MLAVPLTWARPVLAWDTQMLSMKNRIIQRKLNLCVHLKKLGEKDLAKQVFEEQRESGSPDLVSGVQKGAVQKLGHRKWGGGGVTPA